MDLSVCLSAYYLLRVWLLIRLLSAFQRPKYNDRKPGAILSYLRCFVNPFSVYCSREKNVNRCSMDRTVPYDIGKGPGEAFSSKMSTVRSYPILSKIEVP